MFPITDLQAFTADELAMLFGNADEDWSVESKYKQIYMAVYGYLRRPAALSESLKADHGFHVESRAIRDLIEIMSEYDGPSRRSYLQFITGSPKLPIGGMCASSVLTQSSLTTTLRRLQGSQSSSHRCPQTSRSTTHGRRLSPECHDLRQLPQTAGVLVQVYDAGEAIGCNAGRRRKFPLVLKDPSSLSHIIVALPILPCIVITCLYHHV